MPKNVGKIDRYLRIGAGALLLLLAAMGTIGAWGYLGIVPLLTGIFSTCPAYTLFKINTCGADGEQKPTAT